LRILGCLEESAKYVVLLQQASTWISVWEFIAQGRMNTFQGLLEIIMSEVCHEVTMVTFIVPRLICKTSRKNILKTIEACAVFALI